MAHEELLAWSAGRLPWQQDALRRLATQGELTGDDLLALRLQIEQAAGLPVEDVPEPVPLAEEHLNQAASNNPGTVLASLGPVRHVDRLSSNQPPLRFAINGITLVYGANASGKSGYCRIARQLCRSLSPVDLRGNVYDAGAPAPPEVAVAFRVGGDDQPKEALTWYADQDPPAELSRISVFDTASARVYVDRERRIEFLPYELDLMNKLGLACRSLEEGFKERLAAVNATVSTRLPEAYHEGTTVQVTLARLVTQTALRDLPTAPELQAFGSWSAEKQAAFETTGEHLRQDPQVMIRLRSEATQALETVKEEALAIEEELADPSLAAIRQKRRDAENTRRAVEAAARDLFSDQPIPDLGSETWRLMLTYAREFSLTVFPDAPTPQLASGGLCVLCQQDLDDNAVARMAAFDDYIAGRAAEESVAADRVLAEHRDSLLAFSVRPRREVEILLAGYAGLSDASKEAVAGLAAFVEKAVEPRINQPAPIHRALIRLADRGGTTTIMTTNFDLMLESAAKRLRVPAQSYALGSIPRPTRRREFSGVLHIHGALTRDTSRYSDLVLTDQDFGEFYLRRRVVPDLIYDAARLFHLVLVGYRADDPPMRYLLHAVAAEEGRFDDLKQRYIFVGSGEADDVALEDWRSRGIEPIRYDADQDHSVLLRTLQRWAEFSAITGQQTTVDREIRRIVKSKRAHASDADRGLFDHLFRRVSPDERVHLAEVTSKAGAEPAWLDAIMTVSADRERQRNS